MKTTNRLTVIIISGIPAILVIFILPFFSVPQYSLVKNTLSELGAQFTPNAWIMNLTFIYLAFDAVIAGWKDFKGFVTHRILLLMSGLSLVLLSIFNHAPLTSGISYDLAEDGWHSYFGCTAVLSFILLSLATSFILKRQGDKLLAIATGISVLFLTVLMSEINEFAGIWQRLIFIISFGWMIHSTSKGTRFIKKLN
jgi:hypothetical membrane protein